jgi:predicted amino acid dehydrogenase
MEANPDVIYKKILKLCEKARVRGAKIMGLGAYTKIVGDAGVTIDRLSPIPVTTGNSLSAASTLWAAKLAIEKLGFVKKDQNGTFLGTVMIVGATGSIGAVSAKVLAHTWSEIIIVAPRAYKLIELKEEILKINPKVKIDISTDADKYSSKSDLIITTTSGQGKTILDIMKVKSGAVICDVSRPFDISLEEAIRRPDVMVIASGEVVLPGNVNIKIDLGLEGNLVYACLAETALLAMEGKLESFTLSRNINFEKVIEIDRMAHEHGVRLAEIMGHNGAITEQEFVLCREHALIKRKKK